MKLRNISAGTLMLLGFAVVNSSAQSESIGEFTMRITQELSNRNDEAAELFTVANLARDQGSWGNAEELYKRVGVLVPDFSHVARRLCYVVLEQGRRDEAVGYSREALTYAESPENLQAIIVTLIDPSSSTLTAVEREEVSQHSEELLSRMAIHPGYLTVECQSAITIDDLGLLDRSVARLEAEAPQEVYTQYYSWILVMSQCDHRRAAAILERAYQRGLSEDAYRQMRQQIRASQPLVWRLAPIAAIVFGAWMAGLILLFIAGDILSRSTLRAVAELYILLHLHPACHSRHSARRRRSTARILRARTNTGQVGSDPRCRRAGKNDNGSLQGGAGSRVRALFQSRYSR